MSLLYHLPMSKKAPVADQSRIGKLRTRVGKAPTGPGVYRWLDCDGKILYVGKAKNLRNRLRSYVPPVSSTKVGPWKKSFLEQIDDFDVTVTTSELEALLLETNLIKTLKPKYNVLMKDDKNYLFIRVTVKDAYPTVETVRRLGKDDAKYFGPYLSSERVGAILDLLHEALGYRACGGSIELLNRGVDPGTRIRPCLDFQIGRCCGLCAGAVDVSEYGRRVGLLIDFLKGNEAPVRRILEERMQTAASERKFERAAKLRNYLRTLEQEVPSQIATDTTREDSDVFGVAILSSRAHVVILHRRAGRLIGESHFALAGQADSVASVLEQFLPQFYDEGREIPPMILLPEESDELSLLRAFLSERRGGAVELQTPSRGRKNTALQLAEKNAQQKARQEEMKWEAERRNTVEASEGLQTLLNLPALPRRIEGYDISHLGGTQTVGSMVVILHGKAANDQYRHFTIHSMQHGAIDDYRALKEVLRRRLRHLAGGFQRETGQWKAQGVTIGKARKAEGKTKDFLVARHENELVGFVRLKRHEGKLVELCDLWVTEEYSRGPLGQFLIRAALRSLKKQKAYVQIPPALELSYGSLGFRHVLKTPSVFRDSSSLVMVFDPVQHKPDSSLQSTPDLLVIDGGKGQLSAALEILKELELQTPVIGLAKREEEIFVPGRSAPVPVPKDSPSLFLLMRLRDEAHRFANRLREKKGIATAKRSVLDTIPTIGPETRQQLLRRYKTIDAIRAAPEEELMKMLTTEQYEGLRRFL